MSIEKNKEIVRRLFEIVRAHDLALLDEVLDENVIWKTPEVGEIRGLDVYREVLREAIATFPDLDPQVQVILAEGDMVSSVHRVRGTHEGDYDGIPPSHRGFDLFASDLFTLRDDKIVEHQEFYDVLTILRQIGGASEELRPGGKEWPRGGAVLKPSSEA
jgi:steroid delta-isomerase-like uncharacterized protein